MTKQRSVTHATFVIERVYPASPQRVFQAFADPVVKARWFGCVDDWDVKERSLDFRVGGREIWCGGPPGGPVHRNDTVYMEIVPDERIVWTYAMQLDATRISVSLATVELEPEGSRTRLVFTEQGAFLDGHDNTAERERGTRDLLDSLDAELRRAPARAGEP